MEDKLNYKPFGTIKHPLKLVAVGVLLFLGLFLVNQKIYGATIIEENFESYEVGHQLNEYSGWVNSTDDWTIADTYCYNLTKCAVSTSSSSYARHIGGSQINATGSVSFWFRFDVLPTTTHAVYFYDDTGPQLTNLKFLDNEIRYYAQGLTYLKIFEFDANEDNIINAEFDFTGADATFRVRLNSENWTDWLDPAYHDTPHIDRLDFFKQGNGDIWRIDEITEAGSVCEFYETWNTCRSAGCYWDYSYWLGFSICQDYPTGACESGIDTCQNCNSTSTCEATEYCYWFDNGCRYGTGECGFELEIQFCENQSECESAGGYWYSDFCWIFPEVSLTNWDDYYAEYGDYATATAWITNVASTTSLFLGQMGGFLSVFENNFDLMEAFERGKNFGGAIPLARGYLTIFNDFLGGLPIGEFFIFLIIFMLAVGVFRIMRNLFQMIKFW